MKRALFLALVVLGVVVAAPLAAAGEFKRLQAFERAALGVPAAWPCAPAEGGAVVCLEPRGLATLSIELVETPYANSLPEAEGRRAAAEAARMLAKGEEERRGSRYHGWDTVDGGALEGGYVANRDGAQTRVFEWALLVARPDALLRLAVELAAREELFDAGEGVRLASEIGLHVMEAHVR